VHKVKNLTLKLKLTEQGSIYSGLVAAILVVLVFALLGAFRSISGHASGYSLDNIRSGISDNCLDDYHSKTQLGAIVDAYGCNGTSAQDWSVNTVSIEHQGLCLSVVNNGNTSGSIVDLETCSSQPGQVWLSDHGGLYNPNSRLCLSAPGNQAGVQLNMASCNPTAQTGQVWTSPLLNLNCTNMATEGAKVACYAEKEWETWQSGQISHQSLLTSYTDGAPYEQWCADFVSYIYKEAGYPFSNGETNGWDENNANNIVNQGFSVNYPGSYVPQLGDIGFFDYNGGHVEIVVSGGMQPTFIYGDSATIDPTTGNGQMEANTITSDGNLGSITYYMSPT
jgi:hypothetical protein